MLWGVNAVGVHQKAFDLCDAAFVTDCHCGSGHALPEGGGLTSDLVVASELTKQMPRLSREACLPGLVGLLLEP